MNIKERLAKLEKSQPKINPLAHLTDAELKEKAELVLIKLDEIAKRDCPNCIGCETPQKCENLVIKAKIDAERLRNLLPSF